MYLHSIFTGIYIYIFSLEYMYLHSIFTGIYILMKILCKYMTEKIDKRHVQMQLLLAFHLQTRCCPLPSVPLFSNNTPFSFYASCAQC